MSNLKKRLNKVAEVVGFDYDSEELKIMCVESILKNNGIVLKEMTAKDLVEELEMNDTLTFDNIGNLVEEWVNSTEENYPEFIQ